VHIRLRRHNDALFRRAVELINTAPAPPAAYALAPRKALQALAVQINDSDVDAETWIKRARTSSILGSCPRSLASFRSGVRHWLEFVLVVKKDASCAFPPTVDLILAWSYTFSNVGTFSNYLGYLRTICHCIDCEAPPVQHAAINRARVAIVKRELSTGKPRLFIQRTMLANMVNRTLAQSDGMRWAMLYLAAYVFLLRLPSEALPMVRGCADSLREGHQSVLYMDDDTLCLYLRRRKNKSTPTVIKRMCTCTGSPALCPVHQLWFKLFEPLDIGTAPWARFTANRVRDSIRSCLGSLRVPNASLYGTHDFRRGHACDLQEAGVPIDQIRVVGHWARVQSMKPYLEIPGLEQSLVLEVAIQSDDEEEWID